MPERRPGKRAAARKTAAKPTGARTTPTPAKASVPAASGPAVGTTVEVCPRCGTTKFAPEDRTRIDGRRTVRYRVLVCERGHTFGRPVRR
jgi:hypothetical protein